jgi:2,3,4,5-tetrahydropyridine-2-carboxylate N-succinyltransferase
VRGVGLSGKDAGLLTVEKTKRTKRDPDSMIEHEVDLGFVGEPTEVDTKLIDRLISSDADWVPVIAPIGVSTTGETFNVNADTVAGAVAGKLAAKRMLLLTDVPGVKGQVRRNHPPDERQPGARPDRRWDRDRRHDPQARNRHRRRRGRGPGRSHPGWSPAPRHAGGAVHRARGGDLGAGRMISFAGTDTWLFDLDDTLYPEESGIMDLIRARITAFVMRITGLDEDEARVIQRGWFEAHGASLPGLLREYDVSVEDFLTDIHDIPLDAISPDPRLGAALERLPGRRFVFTNGSREYAERVLERLGRRLFEDVFHIEDGDLIPKPDPSTFRQVMAPASASIRRAPPSSRTRPQSEAGQGDMGMTTVLIGDGTASRPGSTSTISPPSLLDFLTDLTFKEPPHDRPRSSGIRHRSRLGRPGQCLAATHGEVRKAVDQALRSARFGQARVASRGADGVWTTHQWLKKAVLLSFRLNDNRDDARGDRGPPATRPRRPLVGQGAQQVRRLERRPLSGRGLPLRAGLDRAAGAFIGKQRGADASFVNIGAFVDEGSMVDAWATVGSCAQIGKNVHLSGGAGIGGVLEPLQANPTIIEDGCFIGARAEVAEGVIVREGAVLAMGVYLSGSTKIVDRATGEVFRGEVPAYSVVVPASSWRPPGVICPIPTAEPVALLRFVDIVNFRRGGWTP